MRRSAPTVRGKSGLREEAADGPYHIVSGMLHRVDDGHNSVWVPGPTQNNGSDLYWKVIYFILDELKDE